MVCIHMDNLLQSASQVCYATSLFHNHMQDILHRQSQQLPCTINIAKIPSIVIYILLILLYGMLHRPNPDEHMGNKFQRKVQRRLV